MNLQFNATTINPDQTPEKLPPDWYPVTITNSEEVDDAVVFTLTVQPGHAYAGRTHKHRLSLRSQNPQAYEISWKNLSALCHVVGQVNLQDTRQLHNIPFQAHIGPQKKKPEYNEVKRVKDAQGNDPGKQGQQSAPQVAQPSFAPTPAPAAPVTQPQVAWAQNPTPAAPSATPIVTSPAVPNAPYPSSGPTAPAQTAPAPAPWTPSNAAPVAQAPWGAK